MPTSLRAHLHALRSKTLRAHWADLKAQLPSRLNQLHRVVTLPSSIYFLTWHTRVHPAYKVTRWDRAKLAAKFFWNNSKVPSLSFYRGHLVMAMKLLELPPDVPGCVVECGCFKGAMTVNLSIICKIVGRKLVVYDSFEGLPEPTQRDYWPEGVPFIPGVFMGALDEVRENVARYGAPEVCEFRKGWFKDTLPSHADPVALAVVDVDYHSSLYDCVTQLWPHLVDQGLFFIDEYVSIDYCSIFFSEKFWQTHFQCDPPGLFGAGTGVQVGEYYVGPWKEMYPSDNPASLAFARKGLRALWDYYPNEHPTQSKRASDASTADPSHE
jgi:O-methyltransferase